MRSLLSLAALSLGVVAACGATGCGQATSGASPDAAVGRDAGIPKVKVDAGDARRTETRPDARNGKDAEAAPDAPVTTDTGVTVDAGVPRDTGVAVDAGVDTGNGGCTSGADCPAAEPVCGPDHACAAPAVTPAATLSYTAVLITDAAYADGFQQLALMHTLTGVPTQVVTIESICAANPTGCDDSDACNDTPKAIKDYIIKQQAAGLQHVVFGGDGTIVPSRQTSDSFSNAILGVSYNETFYTDYYFSDLSEWDTNSDCVYGDPTTDKPTYLPVLDVTRVSVSSPAELQTYITKVEAYLTAYETSQIQTALFLSNVATELTIPGTTTTIPVDSALYFETPGRTLSQMPSDFAITKLYSSLGTVWPDASPLTVTAETSAFEAGANVVVHSGHGDISDLTVEQDGSNEFSGAMAYALVNSQYPIMLSCACEAATFVDGDQCAGQNFITAPAGAGVGYLGNSTIGLGIAGGMQLIDQVLMYTFVTSTGGVLIGEAVMAGHANLPTTDEFSFEGIPVPVQLIDAASWRWTQKAATYLGDGLLPVYSSDALAAPTTFTVTDKRLGDFATISIQPAGGATGTLTVNVDSSFYPFTLAGTAAPVTLTVGGSPTLLTYGFASPGMLMGYQQVTLP